MISQDLSFNNQTTIWGERYNIQDPLHNYPRPHIWRQSHLSLNGVWKYVITDVYSSFPKKYDNEIIVPFSPECLLSGVFKGLQKGQKLWYMTEFFIPKHFLKDKLILNFGAVDQACAVYVNGVLSGEHHGGYLPFSFDITNLLVGEKNKIELEVYDYTEKSIYSYGGQSQKNEVDSHAVQSGIWQPVWLESVNENYIKDIKITPIYDRSCVQFEIDFVGTCAADIEISADGRVVARGTLQKSGKVDISLRTFTSWSPENPYLYDVKIKTESDLIETYFAMRKISYITDSQGKTRFALNNKPYLVTGVIHQLHWPDGYYTPASDEAFISDIATIKSMGFNAVRIVNKIEALRFYYHCDRLGLLVWQDIPAGGSKFVGPLTKLKQNVGFKHLNDINPARFGRRSKESQEHYFKQLQDTISLLYSSPSVVAYTLFDQAKGQFESLAHCEEVWKLDATRLVDNACGYHDQGGGDIKSRYCYGNTTLKADSRVLEIAGYGGFGLVFDQSATTPVCHYLLKSDTALFEKIENFYHTQIMKNIKKGASVMFYKQFCDVGNCVEGLVTYNRKLVKVDVAQMKRLNTMANDWFKNSLNTTKKRGLDF